MQPSVWIMGGPGAGKGSQCSLIAAKYGYSHLSTGDLLRSEVLAGTERWVRLYEIMDKGQLVPDEEVIALLAESMAKLPDSPGFLIDGFPANMSQANIFLEKISGPSKIIVLEVPEEVMSQRLKDGVNFNDQDDTIKKRIFTFLEKTKPTIKSVLKKWPIGKIVRADRSKEEVFADIEKIMDNWVGIHGECNYVVLCDQCNMNATICVHNTSTSTE
eukprot:GFUD01011665.1.p1 GENE.GFUD01011665.1~~GFUD01011665.1.p1  ORF type:complete len:216 (+),score=69.55 GFUD01011665.1:25-672(+)